MDATSISASEMPSVNYGRYKMTIIYIVLLKFCNDVKLTTPYIPHHVLELVTTT